MGKFKLVKETEAATNAVPGKPEIPSEASALINMILRMTCHVIAMCKDVIVITINMAGKIPAQPFIPMVAPILGTKVEVTCRDLNLSRKVSSVTGKVAKLERVVNAT